MIKFLSLQILLEGSVSYPLELFLDFILTVRDVSVLNPVLEGAFHNIELGFLAMFGYFIQ